MTLPACLDPNWHVANPAWDRSQRFTEVILHGVGCMRRVEILRLWFNARPEPVHIPLGTRIWVDQVARKMIEGLPSLERIAALQAGWFRNELATMDDKPKQATG